MSEELLTEKERKPFVKCLEEEAVWDIEGLLEAQRQKDKQRYEQEIKKLTGELYVAQEEIRIFKQKRLDRPDREKIEDILFEEQCHLSCSISEEDNEQVIHEIAVKIQALFDTGLEVALKQRDKEWMDGISGKAIEVAEREERGKWFEWLEKNYPGCVFRIKASMAKEQWQSLKGE